MTILSHLDDRCRLFSAFFAVILLGRPGITLPASERPVAAEVTAARESLARIDYWMVQRWNTRGISACSLAEEAAYARRVFLDLTGRIPAIAELDHYLADERTDKRAQLVDSLLTGHEFATHMADVFDVVLMGRGSKLAYRGRVKHGWRNYLERVFHQNRPWDVVVREILLARPTGEHDRGAVWFLYERKDKHQEIAEAISPAIFGIQIQCAQCHDHPLADEIEQRHYWGLVAFFRRSKNVDTPLGPRVSESAVGGFDNFANLTGTSQPNLLAFFGDRKVDEVRPESGAEVKDADEFYDAPLIASEPRVPKFSRRAKFADEILARHPLVARAMVNRIWALLLGRGLVHPHDKLDSSHPPSHPELLSELSAGFAQSGYDIRQLVRAIVLSQPYQLSSYRPAGSHDPADFASFLERPLIAEAWVRSVERLVRDREMLDEHLLEEVREQFSEVLPEDHVTPLKNALFLANNGRLNAYLHESQASNHLPTILAGLPTHAARVTELFRRAFSRVPDPDELAAAVDFLRQREARLPEAIEQLVWATITSAEFRFNH